MRVLITGATGLIGQEIVTLCREQSIAVNYLTTRKQKIQDKEGYKGFHWNPGTGEIDEKCLEGVSAIINLVGATVSKRWTKAHKKTILQSRVQSAQLLLLQLLQRLLLRSNPSQYLAG